ncbi:hypothetical protein HDU83_005402 [Entophlyctis luteolus]|nr:hypothetical protein HDU83_005402 [Entophlyctis luteolus]
MTKRTIDHTDETEFIELARRSRAASLRLQTASAADRNRALERIHHALDSHRSLIKKQNARDLENARTQNYSPQLIKRLDLQSSDKVDSMIQGVKEICEMPDPVGKTLLSTKFGISLVFRMIHGNFSRMDDGLELFRVSCPIGVVLIIFESRPEVVVNIAALAIKSGNAVILKGGKEAQQSNAILAKIIYDAISTDCGNVHQDSVLLVESRTAIDILLKMDEYIDLVIPRGSNQLVKHIQSNTRIPVLGHADGLCATYFDESLDEEMAIRVLIDAKTTAPSACNSTETLLIHESHLATPFFQTVVERLIEANVKIRAHENVFSACPKHGSIALATADDFDTEFLDTILAVKAVPSLAAAIAHINSHGSHHTDAIVTRSADNADMFMRSVDSAGVFWNSSTRFADGFRFGFGAEVGVSTNKTHARGPVGLEGLLIYKYRLHGSGQCTADYGSGKKKFKHEALHDADESRFQL